MREINNGNENMSKWWGKRFADERESQFGATTILSTQVSRTAASQADAVLTAIDCAI